MRLEVTRKSDLAVRALRTLDDNGRMKGPAVAEAIGATAGFVAQVLNPLVRAGWVRSDPGPTGGYVLTATLSDVSVLDVIEAIEGPTDAGRCVLAERPCNEHGQCALHAAWMRAQAKLLQELDRTSVAAASLVEVAS